MDPNITKVKISQRGQQHDRSASAEACMREDSRSGFSIAVSLLASRLRLHPPAVTFLILGCINAREHLWGSVCQAGKSKVQGAAWNFDGTGRNPSHVKQPLSWFE